MFKKSIIMSMLMFLMVLSMSTGVFADDLTVVEEMPYYEVEAGMSEEVQAAIADIKTPQMTLNKVGGFKLPKLVIVAKI